eukprot:Platyproteum_vivax@DN2636_c0_g1_i2.p1
MSAHQVVDLPSPQMSSVDSVVGLSVVAVANLATISNAVSYLSNVYDMSFVMQRKSAANVSHWPYLTSAVQACMWILYAFLLEDTNIFRVNILGAGVGVLCLTVLCVYSSRLQRNTILIMIALFFGFLVCYLSVLSQTVHDLVTLQNVVGYTSMMFSICCFLSPLVQVTRTSFQLEHFPKTFVVFNFLAAALWAEYGVIINSQPVIIVNTIGVFIGGAQLAAFLFFHYRQQKPPQNVKGEEVASAFSPPSVPLYSVMGGIMPKIELKKTKQMEDEDFDETRPYRYFIPENTPQFASCYGTI